MFSMQSVSKNPLIATFKLPSASYLNLGQFKNAVLRKGFKKRNSSNLYNWTKSKPLKRNLSLQFFILFDLLFAKSTMKTLIFVLDYDCINQYSEIVMYMNFC